MWDAMVYDSPSFTLTEETRKNLFSRERTAGDADCPRQLDAHKRRPRRTRIEVVYKLNESPAYGRAG
jgi:hypothetical protein